MSVRIGENGYSYKLGDAYNYIELYVFECSKDCVCHKLTPLTLKVFFRYFYIRSKHSHQRKCIASSLCHAHQVWMSWLIQNKINNEEYYFHKTSVAPTKWMNVWMKKH